MELDGNEISGREEFAEELSEETGGKAVQAVRKSRTDSMQDVHNKNCFFMVIPL